MQTKRRLKLHLNDDIHHLDAGNHSELYTAELQVGIEKTRQSLADFDLAAGL
jgi:hypothetical protein